MEQTTLNRGHLAFIEDQTAAAVEAFKAGELADCVKILQSVEQYIEMFLAEAGAKRV